MGEEHELVRLVAGLVVGMSLMVKEENVAGVKTWKGRLIEA